MRYLLIGILGGLFFAVATPAAAPAALYPQLQTAPAADASYNWAGYVAVGERYTGVSGSWVVPSVSPGNSLAADAAWVGIGGAESEDLIQAGTQAIADSSGRVAYQAWVEILPQPSVPLPIEVAPGDHVSVSLTLIGPRLWRLDFLNDTSGERYHGNIVYDSSFSSAEWIEEMPSMLRGGFIPLSNFGTVHFTAASATVNGEVRELAELNAEPLSMVNRRGEEIAVTSVLGASGGFNVTRTSAAAYVPRPRIKRTFEPVFLPLLPESGIPCTRHP